MAKHAGLTTYSYNCKNNCSAEERLRLYEKVLEKFLKDPTYARQNHFPGPFRNTPPKP
ncbi:MAG: hypothetical protein HY052_00225 [Proteobacteria bacterium]|nr:hypothetical protein [Pseudomonadota bacterium]